MSQVHRKLGKEWALTWLGHATFKLRTPGGKTLYVDPWLEKNPSCPEAERNPSVPIDAMLVTHGHFDHISDVRRLAKDHAGTIACIFETYVWLESKGVKTASGMNKGGTQQVCPGVTATMVHADHSCGIIDDDGRIVYGGDPAGYVITLEDGTRLYHAGDTNVFGDMRLIGELYRPDVALLPIGGLYTMGPREAALAVRLLGVKKVVPMHFGTFPPLTGTPAELAALLGDVPGVEVIALEPGDTLS